MRIIVSMAGRAILRRALEDIIYMAGLTGYGVMLAIQMEGKFRVIDRGGFPAVGCVTSCALRSQLTGVGIIVYMAGSAVLRRTLELTVNVTALACYGVM